jgi:hypothetical protein
MRNFFLHLQKIYLAWQQPRFLAEPDFVPHVCRVIDFCKELRSMDSAQLNQKDQDVLKKVMFLRMRDFCDMQYKTHGMFVLAYGDEMHTTEALFEKLFGAKEAQRCREEWLKIVSIGADAWHDNLTDRGFIGMSGEW